MLASVEGFSERMYLKVTGTIGTGPGDEKHCKILNRLVSLEVSNGIRQLTYEVDPRHVDLLIRGMGFEKGRTKAVTTPAERKDANYNTEPLPQEVVTSFRSGAMRLNFIGADLPHLQFSANVSARGMSTPTSGDLLVLKRAVRYPVGEPRIVQVFKEQEQVTILDADADSNWAQNPIDRKSISCLHLKRGAHMLRASVSTQTVQALSSGEAEFLASVKAASAVLGLRAVCLDLGIDIKLIILGSDSSAAGGILGRIGLGKIRHLDTMYNRN